MRLTSVLVSLLICCVVFVTKINPSPTNTLTVGRTDDPTTTITITPTLSQPVKLECQRTDAFKNWFTGDPRTRVTPTEGEISTKPGHDRTLLISSFQPIHATTYSCVVDDRSSISTIYPVVLVFSSQPTTVTVGRTGDPTTTITVTPTIGQSVELQCTGTSAVKQWYTTGSVVAATPSEISTKGGPTRTLAFSSFTTSHAGTYSCEVQNVNNLQVTTTYPVILATATSAMPSPTPPPRVKDVTVTRGVADGSPSLTVSWTAVSGFGITYTVWYSTSSGTITEPPSGASTTSGVTGTSTTLSGLTQGTMNYIWVAAVSSGGQGLYSTRMSETTFAVPQRIANVDVNRTITEDRPLLTVEWSTPSSDRPIQHYQVDYRVGTSGSWSTWSPNPTFTSVTLTGLQRGTIYQVRVRAVSDVGNGEWSELIGKTTYSGDLESNNMSGCSSSISPQTLGAGIFGGVVVGLVIGAVISCVTTKIVWGAPNMKRCQKRSEQSKLKKSTDEDYEAPGIAMDTNPSYDTVNTYEKVGESSK